MFGATICYLLVEAMFKAKIGEWKNLRPFITGFVATVTSGAVLPTILKVFRFTVACVFMQCCP